MKKILIVLAIVSSTVMARGRNHFQNHQENQGNRIFQRNSSINLSEKEQEELSEFRMKQREANQKEILEIKELDLAIKKELLNEDIDWTKVEALNNEKFQKKSLLNLNCLKAREDFPGEFRRKFSIGRRHHRR